MKKYAIIIKNSFAEIFAYRLNFFLWRIRVITSLLVSFAIWQAIFKSTGKIFGYRESQMMTYIILLAFMNGIVLSSQTFKVAQEINFGNLSNYLLKPFDYFLFNFARDIPEKGVNGVSSIIEIILIIYIIHPAFFFQTSLYTLVIFILFLAISSLLFFEINMILSFIGFWSKETWAPRFIFFILLSFLAGTYFPLDIVPKAIYQVLELLPFTYLVFFPLKIYLGMLSTALIARGVVISLIWVVLLWWLMKFIYAKGLKVYSSEGI